MILFKSVSYKNFLAAGNNPIKVNLDSHGTTLIVGQNGAGKSTIIEAVVFALFNKSFRKINKSQLVNSINEKDCVVEVVFSIGSIEWKVKRGIKPSLFEIYKNDNLLDQSSHAADQQKWLEQSVLKLNYKSFTQIVILGSASFVPFMQLSAPVRREIIEDLLDIRIFSTMNVLLKERIKDTNDVIRDSERSISFIKEKTEMQGNHIKSLEKSAKKTVTQKESKIEELIDEVAGIDSDIEKNLSTVEIKTESLTKFKGLDKELKKLEKKLNTSNNVITRTKKDQDFFIDNDQCPKCTQVLSKELKEKQLKDGDRIIEETKLIVEEYQKKVEDTNNLIEKQVEINRDISDLNWEVKSKFNSIKSKKKLISEIEQEIMDIKGNTNDIDAEKEKLMALASEGMTLHKELKSKKEERIKFDIVSNLLKDTGIKSMIIRKYLPVMNQLINKYLQSLDFYVNFTLNEEFNESIKSRYRDDFTYPSFSEGEKMRIDLALMFTWRAIAKLKNSASTNLLILDEVFDSSLDVAGTEDFLRIIRGGNEDTNIFIISHKGELLHDKFDRVLNYEKVKNFSRVTAL